MKKIILSLLIFITLKLHAQPGGGGGLVIKKIYDKNLKEIILDTSAIKIELLVLDSVMTILNRKAINTEEELYLPPLNHYRHSTKNFGILIKYQNKEYRIDFENILPSNGGGHREKIDSLVLFKPYILSKRDYYHPSHDGNEFQKYHILESVSEIYRRNGITPHTSNKLSELDLIFYSKSYAYNRKPKPWMGDFKNLCGRYRESNFRHEEKELKIFINELEKIIKKYGTNDAFVLLKMKLFYQINSYKEVIDLYEKHSFEYDDAPYAMLLDSYARYKDYNKAIKICEISATKNLRRNKTKSYVYAYHKFFIEIYYQNKNSYKEIQTILDSEEYKQYYQFTFEQLKILQVFCIYKFDDKTIGIGEMNIYNKHCIPNPILKEVYPSVHLEKISREDYCGSLTFGIIKDIL